MFFSEVLEKFLHILGNSPEIITGLCGKFCNDLVRRRSIEQALPDEGSCGIEVPHLSALRIEDGGAIMSNNGPKMLGCRDHDAPDSAI